MKFIFSDAISNPNVKGILYIEGRNKITGIIGKRDMIFYKYFEIVDCELSSLLIGKPIDDLLTKEYKRKCRIIGKFKSHSI